MIRILINGDPYGIPENCDDITLAQHIAMLDVEQSAPAIFREISEEKNTAQRQLMASRFPKLKYVKEVLPYYARVIEAQVGIPAQKLLASAPVEVIEKVFWQIQNAYVSFTDQKQTVFEINGQNWTLPANDMAGSTFGEFAEAAQYEEYAADVASGQYTRMPYVMAVLLRPVGEVFDPERHDEIVEERAEIMRNRSMSTVYQVAFFLTGLKRQLEADLAIYTLSRAVGRSRQEQANLKSSLVGT